MQQASKVQGAPAFPAQHRGNLTRDDAMLANTVRLLLVPFHLEHSFIQTNTHANSPKGVETDPCDGVVKTAGSGTVRSTTRVSPYTPHKAWIPFDNSSDLEDVGGGLFEQLIQLPGNVRERWQVQLICLNQPIEMLRQGAIGRVGSSTRDLIEDQAELAAELSGIGGGYRFRAKPRGRQQRTFLPLRRQINHGTGGRSRRPHFRGFRSRGRRSLGIFAADAQQTKEPAEHGDHGWREWSGVARQ
jgi:hypothetical protein